MPLADINSISIYFETAGEGNPVLFIHGLGSSTRDWKPSAIPAVKAMLGGGASSAD